MDLLYRDLGVNSQRKGNVFAEVFGLYRPRDFRGVVDEWLRQGRTKFSIRSPAMYRQKSLQRLSSSLFASISLLAIAFIALWWNSLHPTRGGLKVSM